MSMIDNALKLGLGVALGVTIVASPISAEIPAELEDIAASTKAKVQAKGCGKDSAKDLLTEVVISANTGPFTGDFLLTFVDAIGLITEASGLYIEAKPSQQLTMALDQGSYDAINAAFDDQLVECNGELVAPLTIDQFNGKFSKDGSAIKITFKATGQWVDLGTLQERPAQLQITTKANSLTALVI